MVIPDSSVETPEVVLHSYERADVEHLLNAVAIGLELETNDVGPRLRRDL